MTDLIAATASEPTDDDFRKAGYTGKARAFPLSEAGCQWIADFNSIPRDKMPLAWCYAPNAGMLAYIEAKAALWKAASAVLVEG